MAGSSSGTTIQDLPVETRMQIFDYLLVEEEPIKIDIIHRRKKCDELVRSGHQSRRDWKHRFKVWSRSKQKWINAPPIDTAVLFANKQFHAEAVHCLYGNNCFNFASTRQLMQVLRLLGDHVQYLRYIDIDERGYERGSTRAATGLLRAAKGFKRLTFSVGDVQRWPSAQVATDLRPFLRTLQKSYQDRGITSSILDVVKLHNFKQPYCGTCRFPWQPVYGGPPCSCDRDALRTLQATRLRAGMAKSLNIEE